jgi:hypothetical protein
VSESPDLDLPSEERILTEGSTEVNAQVAHLLFRFFLAAAIRSSILLYVSFRNSSRVQAGEGGCGGHFDCR